MLSTQHEGVRANTVWRGIGIMCPSGVKWNNKAHHDVSEQEWVSG